MPTRDELANALRKADAAATAGDQSALAEARRLSAAIRAMDTQPTSPQAASVTSPPVNISLGAKGEFNPAAFAGLKVPDAKPLPAPIDPLAPKDPKQRAMVLDRENRAKGLIRLTTEQGTEWVPDPAIQIRDASEHARLEAEAKKANEAYAQWRAQPFNDFRAGVSEAVQGAAAKAEDAIFTPAKTLMAKVDPQGVVPDFIHREVTPRAEAIGQMIEGPSGRFAGVPGALTGGAAEWTATMARDPQQGLSEANQMLNPIVPLSEGYNQIVDASGDLIDGIQPDTGRKFLQGGVNVASGILGMVPGGSLTVDAMRAPMQAERAAMAAQRARVLEDEILGRPPTSAAVRSGGGAAPPPPPAASAPKLPRPQARAADIFIKKLQADGLTLEDIGKIQRSLAAKGDSGVYETSGELAALSGKSSGANLRGLQMAAGAAPGPAQEALVARVNENAAKMPARVSRAATRATGQKAEDAVSTLQELDQRLKAESGPLYEAFHSSPVNPRTFQMEVLPILNTEAGQVAAKQALGAVKQKEARLRARVAGGKASEGVKRELEHASEAVRSLQGYLADPVTGTAIPSPYALDRIKRAFDNQIEAAGQGSEIARDIRGTKSDFAEAVSNATGTTYGQALGFYEGNKRLRDAFDFGTQALNKKTWQLEEDMTKGLKGRAWSSGETEAVAMGVARHIEDLIEANDQAALTKLMKGKALANIATALGSEKAAKQFEQSIRRIGANREWGRRVAGGSDTAMRQAAIKDASAEGEDVVTRALDRVESSGNAFSIPGLVNDVAVKPIARMAKDAYQHLRYPGIYNEEVNAALAPMLANAMTKGNFEELVKTIEARMAEKGKLPTPPTPPAAPTGSRGGRTPQSNSPGAVGGAAVGGGLGYFAPADDEDDRMRNAALGIIGGGVGGHVLDQMFGSGRKPPRPVGKPDALANAGRSVSPGGAREPIAPQQALSVEQIDTTGWGQAEFQAARTQLNEMMQDVRKASPAERPAMEAEIASLKQALGLGDIPAEYSDVSMASRFKPAVDQPWAAGSAEDKAIKQAIAKKQWTVEAVPAEQITPTQESVFYDYAKAAQRYSGDETMPVLVKQGDQYFVADGHHRLMATKGYGPIRARVIELPPSPGAPKPVQNGLGSSSLPMDEASRMERARAQGFDVDAPLYHGTGKDFESFDTSKAGGARADTGVWLSSSPENASTYAPRIDRRTGAGGAVKPVYVRGNILEIDARGANWNRLGDKEIGHLDLPYPIDDGYSTNDIARWAKQEGYDGVKFRNLRDRGMYADTDNIKPGDTVVIFDPSNIRGKFAKFDPAESSSSKLLAGLQDNATGYGTAGGMVAGGTFAQDTDGNGKISPEERAAGALGGAVTGGVLGKAASYGMGKVARRLDPPPIGRPRIDQSTFGGVNAKTADRVALERAQQMEKAGADRNAIWDETGWFKGVDGKWRFEIDDSASKLTPSEPTGPYKWSPPYKGPLVGVLKDAEAVGAYPDMAMARTVSDFNPKNSQRGTHYRASEHNDEIFHADGSSPDDVRSVLHHEMQHGVQTREDFATGGNPEQFRHLDAEKSNEVHNIIEEAEILRRSIKDPLLKRLADDYYWATDAARKRELEGVLDLYGPGRKLVELEKTRHELVEGPSRAYNTYRRLAGETEARNVQTRRDFTPEERRAKRPWETQDVPDDQQIVRFGGGKAESRASQNGFSGGNLLDPLADTYGGIKQMMRPDDPRHLNPVQEVLQGLPDKEKALIARNASQASPASAIAAAETPEALANLLGRAVRSGDKGAEAAARDYQQQLAEAILAPQRNPQAMDAAEKAVTTLDRKMANDAWFPAREAERDSAMATLLDEAQRSGGGIPATPQEIDRLRSGLSQGFEQGGLNMSPRDVEVLSQLIMDPERAKEAAAMMDAPLKPWVSDAERKALAVGVPAVAGGAGLAGLIMANQPSETQGQTSASEKVILGDKTVSRDDLLSAIIDAGVNGFPGSILSASPDAMERRENNRHLDKSRAEVAAPPVGASADNINVPDGIMPTANPNESPTWLNGRVKDTVVRAQQRLMALGYAPKSLREGDRFDDGRAGFATRGAVEAYQRDNRLPITGDLDPMTLRSLLLSDANYGPEPYAIPRGARVAN